MQLIWIVCIKYVAKIRIKEVSNTGVKWLRGTSRSYF